MEQLHETLGELQDVRERIRSAHAVLERIQLVAPVNGVVVKMRYHTPGGVVEPGRSILDLLPVDETLLIEVRSGRRTSTMSNSTRLRRSGSTS